MHERRAGEDLYDKKTATASPRHYEPAGPQLLSTFEIYKQNAASGDGMNATSRSLRASSSRLACIETKSKEFIVSTGSSELPE
eukprot:4110465-Heterocapsa_arctica.AAC.2